MSPRSGLVAVVVGVVGLSGCGGGPKLVPVSGTVTLNGKPFRDAQILFLPDDSNKAGMAGADLTGPEGNYKAMTNGRSGLVPGKYKVVVVRTTVDTTKVRTEFKDDPYMAKLVIEGPDGGALAQPSAAPPQSTKSTEIKGEFEREVEQAGGTLDFDVKAEVAKN